MIDLLTLDQILKSKFRYCLNFDLDIQDTWLQSPPPDKSFNPYGIEETVGVFPAALKRPIAKWYLTPGKGSDLFTQEDKEDTAFVRGVPGTCTNENLVDFFQCWSSC